MGTRTTEGRWIGSQNIKKGKSRVKKRKKKQVCQGGVTENRAPRSVRPLALAIALLLCLLSLFCTALRRLVLDLPSATHAVHAAQDLEFRLEARARHALLFPQALDFLELRLQVAHRLVHEQLLERPLLDVPRFVLLQVVDVLHGARQDRPLRLLARARRHDPPELVDPLVDVPAAPAFDFFLHRPSASRKKYS